MKIGYSIVAIVISLSFTAFSQEVAKNVSKQCDALTARQYVEQQAIESKSATESDQRINVLIRVADYFWDRDNESARQYFADAFKLAQERFKERGIVNTSKLKFLREDEPDYRFVVARAVAKLDPLWAQQLNAAIMKSFDEDEERKKREEYKQDDEIGKSLELALLLFDSNESAAVAVIRRLMDYPLNRSWNFVFLRIWAKNPQIANQLYSELLLKHSNDEVQRLLYLSAYPFGRRQTPTIMGYDSGPQVTPDFVPNPDIQRQFLRTLLKRISSLSPDAIAIYGRTRINEATYAALAIGEFSSIINHKFPELRADLVRATTNADSLLTDQNRKTLEDNKKFQEQGIATFSEKIKALEEADVRGTLNDFQIVTMIIGAKNEEDLKALEKWLDRIKDPIVEEKSVNFFYFTSSKIAIKEKQFDAARKLADKVPQIEYRAVLYFDIADVKFTSPLTRYESLEILNEVYKVAEKAPDSVEKAQVFLGVAFMFEKIDRFNSVDTLSKAINTANKLDNPNLFTSNVLQAIEGKDFGVYSSYTVPGFDINRTFEQISKNDFQGAISMAGAFTDRYLRILAILASVKNCEKEQFPKTSRK